MSEHSLLDKLQHLVTRFEEVSTLITDPSVIADMNRYVKLNKEYSDLQKIVEVRNRYKMAIDGIEEARQILESESDSDLRQMANEELSVNTEMLPALEEQIKLLLIPADPEDAKNVIMEIRGGTGGDEAAIFAGDLFKMPQQSSESRVEERGCRPHRRGTASGFEIIFTVTGSLMCTAPSSMNRACTAMRRYPRQRHRDRYIPRQPPRWCCPKQEFDVELNPADIDFHAQWCGRSERQQGGDKGTAYPQAQWHRVGLPASPPWLRANWPCRCCVPSSMTSSSPNDRVTSPRRKTNGLHR